MSKELTTQAQIRVMAKSVATTGMFNIKNEEVAFVLMCIADAEGLLPIQAVQKYCVINGMPSLKSTEIQARFQNAGGKLRWVETSNDKAICELEHPSYNGKYLSEFNMEDAKLMGLSTKDNYKRMPKQMLMARAISMGVRAVFPSCLNNMYSDVEAQDLPKEEVEVVEVTETVDNNYKELLTIRLRKLDFTNAMIKEFATKYDLANNVELLQELANENDKFMKLIEEFEDGGN
jgi:hypothetical protein